MKDFHKWRLQQMQRFSAETAEMHFHKCADSSYRHAAKLLKAILVQMVECPGEPIILNPEAISGDLLLDFLDEMDFAYIHPRSSSHHFIMHAQAAGRSPLATRTAFKNL